MSCSIARQDTIHQYVAGTLGESDVEDFEVHLLTCAECRAAVNEGTAIRAAFAHTPPAARLGRTPGRRAAWVGVFAVAAAAVFMIARMPRGGDRLAAFRPPTFAGVVVRGDDSDSSRALVDSGMAAYVRGDFRVAARDLRRGAAADSSPGVTFYLAASLLADGNAGDAVAAGRRAYVPTANPFAADARVIVAKAWLRLGRFDSALVELNDVRRAADVALRDSIASRVVR
jgi:hypothetical protein